MDKELLELEEEMSRIMNTPPGTCYKCGTHFFTLSQRIICNKCLGGIFEWMGEPFSAKGIAILFVLTLLLLSSLLFLK